MHSVLEEHPTEHVVQAVEENAPDLRNVADSNWIPAWTELVL